MEQRNDYNKLNTILLVHKSLLHEPIRGLEGDLSGAKIELENTDFLLTICFYLNPARTGDALITINSLRSFIIEHLGNNPYCKILLGGDVNWHFQTNYEFKR